MAMSAIEKVFSVFEGVTSSDPDLATKYMNEARFVEHAPALADGVEGFREYVRQAASGDHRIQSVRAFQDGAYVVAHSEGAIKGQSVFFDVFRFEDGLIVEHWSFSAPGAAPNMSGHTQTDGPVVASGFENTEKNKTFVKDYYETVHVSGRHDDIPKYFHGDACIRHEPGVRDGVGAFMNDLERLVRNRTIDEIKLVLGQGDFVFIVAAGTVNEEPCAYIDLYRVEDAKIAERWGFPQQIPPPPAWRNSNGPF
ncbi:MAG: nuclear transport factor 2 family protein [Edaphobacter sp.]|uniref:nuclear transport factor 2 family protein n=1 Tax=Edaphobacter sp. TaxID=1934404 RepID=UPI0023A76487|nr:nuclear transport factor 2 family protein [Edaphobacter sp.]MDE1177534.1 nuclear transport factor 2 family protein [Edaphobacter sp.]